MCVAFAHTAVGWAFLISVFHYRRSLFAERLALLGVVALGVFVLICLMGVEVVRGIGALEHRGSKRISGATRLG